MSQVLGGGGGSSVSDFLSLTDTPDSYASQALKLVRVNVGETALEFVATSALTGINADTLDGIDSTGFALASHTHTSSQITDFNSSVIALLTDANIPNTITLDNITQITNRSHTSLTDIGTNTHAAIDSFIAAAPTTYLKLDGSNDPITGNIKINVNSTTAFFVEQDGVKDNTFIVDTTNARVGVNKVPSATFDVSGDGNTVASLTSTTDQAYILMTSSVASGVYFGNYQGHAFFQCPNTKQIQFYVDGGVTLAALFDDGGNVGIGVSSPTAVLHLKAGTTAAGTAPLKFTSGSLLTTPEAGAIEFLTDKFYGTITTGAARKEFYIQGGTDVSVADGGTGVSSLTAYAVLCGGTTSTNPVQSIASVGTSGQVLTSNGAGALPTFQAASGTPGGSTTQMQYNNAGAFGGTSGLTWDGTNLTFATTQKLYLRDSNCLLYSDAANQVTLSGSTKTTIGVAGDIVLGDGTERTIYPQTDAKINLGKSTNRFKDLWLIGDITDAGTAPRTWKLSRNTSGAGQPLSIESGAAASGGTSQAGGEMVFTAGIGTGNARPPNISFRGPANGTASGTTDQGYAWRLVLNCTEELTDGVATTIVSNTIANGSVIAGQIRYAVEVTDGTDFQIEEGCVSYHVTNKAGAIANNTTVKFGNQQAVTAGTLTVTFTITAANPALLQCNANTSLVASTGYPRITYSYENFTQQNIVVQ